MIPIRRKGGDLIDTERERNETSQMDDVAFFVKWLRLLLISR